jgi:methionyl-tRNA formyltransferase
LARLVAAGHEIALVLTQPDRPGGRGMRPLPSPVKRFAAERGLEVFQPESLKPAEAVERIRAARADALVVAAYGLILPPAVLDAGRFGAINIHASLLPRWRGAAPIERALLAGDVQTGISIMQMDAGLDTGPVLASRCVPIASDDNADTLREKLAQLGAEMIVDTLHDLANGRARATPQPAAGVTYARKIEKRETRIDWSRPAREIERAVRAFHPALTVLENEPVRLWRSQVVKGSGAPGRVLDAERLVVACGEDALAIGELQRAGGKRLAAAEFLRGRPLAAGARFG